MVRNAHLSLDEVSEVAGQSELGKWTLAAAGWQTFNKSKCEEPFNTPDDLKSHEEVHVNKG